MEGGQDGVIGRLALNRAVMVLSCPVDHVPILPLRLEELTVREITYGQGRAKKWNVLVNTDACYEVNHALFDVLETSQWCSIFCPEHLKCLSEVSSCLLVMDCGNLLLFFWKYKAVFFLLVCFLCSSWAVQSFDEGSFSWWVICSTVDGNWTDWGYWEVCSVTCGGGVQSRTRTCTNPSPHFGGRDCVGENVEERSCNDNPCPSKYFWLFYVSLFTVCYHVFTFQDRFF